MSAFSSQLSLDLNVFPADDILKTLHIYGCDIDFDCEIDENRDRFIIYYDLKNKAHREDFKNQFMQTLSHQVIRSVVRKETQTIKELIIGRALYQTCILASEDNASVQA